MSRQDRIKKQKAGSKLDSRQMCKAVEFLGTSNSYKQVFD